MCHPLPLKMSKWFVNSVSFTISWQYANGGKAQLVQSCYHSFWTQICIFIGRARLNLANADIASNLFPSMWCLMHKLCMHVSVWPRHDPKRLLCVYTASPIPWVIHFPSFFTPLVLSKENACRHPAPMRPLRLLLALSNFKLKVIEQDWNTFYIGIESLRVHFVATAKRLHFSLHTLQH